MSRTDAHDPMIVRLLDPHRRVADHDHTRGPCDLIPLEGWVKAEPGWREVRCRWTVKWSDLIEHPTCGCWMCSGHYSRRTERRRERYDARRAIEESFNDWLDEQEDILLARLDIEYETWVEGRWDELQQAVALYEATLEIIESREAQLRAYMESVPGVVRPRFL